MDITTANVWSEVMHHIGASTVMHQEKIQSLWSGYGVIVRIKTDSQQYPSLIVKNIRPPKTQSHPRGWQGEASNNRKLRSYQVEANWYEHYSQRCAEVSRLPAFVFRHQDKDAQFIVMTDLDDEFAERYQSLSIDYAKLCLRWLARLHARFLGNDGDGLWPQGCYWHLDTRQDEFAAMQNGALKEAAHRIDAALQNCQYRTLVHGDAKVANFCFDSATPSVAAVDFQYVGLGCGIKDVAYFMGSCLSADQCARHESQLLQDYFLEMGRCIPKSTMQPLEMEWREMYPVAWADFHRFLQGWMPGHAKIDHYMKQQTQLALDRI